MNWGVGRADEDAMGLDEIFCTRRNNDVCVSSFFGL